MGGIFSIFVLMIMEFFKLLLLLGVYLFVALSFLIPHLKKINLDRFKKNTAKKDIVKFKEDDDFISFG